MSSAEQTSGGGVGATLLEEYDKDSGDSKKVGSIGRRKRN